MKCSIRCKFTLGLAVALLLAACSQDETIGDGNILPEGKYPLELTATGIQAVATPATRGSFFEGDWDGVTSVRVRVNEQEKEYSVTPSEDMKMANLAPAEPLKSTDELFWWNSTTDEKTVTAWAPSNYVLNEIIEFPTEWTKEDFAKYDIIGVRQTIGFENRNAPLEFQHMMAKFIINLRKTPYPENALSGKCRECKDTAEWHLLETWCHVY